VASHILAIIAFNQCRYELAVSHLAAARARLEESGYENVSELEVDDGIDFRRAFDFASDLDAFQSQRGDTLRCDLLERLCVTAIVRAQYEDAERHGRSRFRFFSCAIPAAASLWTLRHDSVLHHGVTEVIDHGSDAAELRDGVAGSRGRAAPAG
jgi:hypothetical protein